ncbi:hypothetical protein EDD37DRAFT_592170 [Exophiala viscosa]|uniref:uncharacterized protein n=1 Tax=Exophiala viscosa TaxID=2486360 RepID=UPI00219679AC|nr:hypothetical protein EDD37DRAFT_592170 [Exophiala viscosa]
MTLLWLVAVLLPGPWCVLAHPGNDLFLPLRSRAVSPDNTCGGSNGYTCPSSMPCCSKYGWCGSTADYCGTECQATSLPCCSRYGFCGSTSEYCASPGCQPSYGTCSVAGSASSSTAISTTSPDNSCGGNNGYICPPNLQCCSRYGWCGVSDEYCTNGCQPEFGNCITSTGSPQPTTTAAVVNVLRPKIGSVPYGSVIYDCEVAGDIAITFDDGPYIYTSDLLDLLSSNGIKATFFIVGNLHGAIDQTPDWTSVIQRMNSEGHHIASHTWTHPDLTTLSSGERKDQMYQNEQAFVNILGKFPTYMRPPYLAFDDACQQDMSDLGYHVISTNLDTKDYENDSPTLIVNSEDTFNDTITQNSPSSSSFIVLNHDIHEQTVYTLAQYEIDRAKANGYRPVTVGECLGDPAGNWYRAGP